MGRLVGIVGVIAALWMTMGRWLFGLGGPFTWWYLPSIGLCYLGAHAWLIHRIHVTRSRGRRTSRATVVSVVLSWLCAVGFGFTVPDRVDGELVSILSDAAGSAFSAEMSIALCNPLGIIAFIMVGVAIAWAYADARDPKPEVEVYPGEGEPPRHPITQP